MSLASTAEVYRAMGDADKVALKELQAWAKEKLGTDVSLKDIVFAVTPGMETPEFMKGKC